MSEPIKEVPRRRCDFCGIGSESAAVTFMSPAADAAICWQCVHVAKRILASYGLVPNLAITHADPGREPYK
jgi:hypothetical protein